MAAALLALGLLTAAAADELCLTGNARRGQNLPVAWQCEPEAARPLLDGSEVDARSAGLQDTTIRLRFAEPVRVTRVRVVVYNDPQRSFNAAGRAQVTLRRGDAVVEQGAWVSLDEDAVITCGQDDGLILGSRADLALPGRAAGETLELQLEKKPGAHQMLVREIYVWGLPERFAGASAAPLPGQITENTYSSLRATWDKVPEGTQYVRVRYRAVGETTWRRACFSRSPGVVLWLKPATVYETVLEAVGAPGAAPRPPTRVRLPHPLELRTMGDAWGMNYYPGGGGAYQPRPNEGENMRAMIPLLREAGVRHVRWWPAAPGAAELFAENGMSLLPSVAYTDPAAYARLAATCGVWLTQTTNEPDFSHIFAADFVRQFAACRAAAQRFSPLMCLTGPAIGGEMVGPGSDYLADCYAAGLKKAVDAVDLHPYGKYATPNPPGGVVGGPEGLLASLAAARETMRRAGDAARPVMASESGHPTYEGRWFMPPSSYERQAQWVVRTHLLFVAAGLRRIIWYAFEDEGTDRANPEHCFGLVDWHGQPKPAYAAYRTMTRLLSAAVCEGRQAGLSAPVYGVRCRVGAGGKARYLTPLWDSGGRSGVTVKAAGITGLLSLTGDKLPLPASAAGRLVLTVDENVRYVLSTRPLTVLGHRRLAPPVAPQVQMLLTPTTVTVQPGHTANLTVRLTSEFAVPVTVELDCPSPWGLAPARETLTLQPRATVSVPLALPAPAEAKRHQIHSWDVRCRYRATTTPEVSGDFRRAVFFVVPDAP